MAKRRKRRWRTEDDDLAEEQAVRAGRRKRRRHFVEEQRPPKVVTCHECRHLVVTRSVVKMVNQSWDHAVAYPTLTCFQQRWTLEDPESQPDLMVATEYLVKGADGCPDFASGYPVEPMTWFEEQAAGDGRRSRRR